MKKKLGALVFLLGMCAAALQAQVLLTQSEALSQIFPGAEFRSENLFLSEPQVVFLEQQAKAKLESKLINFQKAYLKNQCVGYVFIDQHG